MKRGGLLIALAWIVALGPGGHAAAQVAGSTRLGVAVEELRTVALGWSAKETDPRPACLQRKERESRTHR
jgi:hypothetical protein